MSRATRPRQPLAVPLRERLLARVLYACSLDCAGEDLGLAPRLLRRAMVGRPLRPWQARAVAGSLRGAP